MAQCRRVVIPEQSCRAQQQIHRFSRRFFSPHVSSTFQFFKKIRLDCIQSTPRLRSSSSKQNWRSSTLLPGIILKKGIAQTHANTMGGKAWNTAEEQYLWSKIAPLAPPGHDNTSQKAKSHAEVVRSWKPLADMMRQEMINRLQPGERLRRDYTAISCCACLSFSLCTTLPLTIWTDMVTCTQTSTTFRTTSRGTSHLMPSHSSISISNT